MQRSRVPLHSGIAKEDTGYEFSEEEDSILKDIGTDLTGNQYQAARMDAAGVDVSTIATSLNITRQTVSNWRGTTPYSQAKNLFISIINRQGLKFRLDCQRQIIAPAYAELIKRMSDPDRINDLGQKDLLDTIKVIGKETRFDSVGVGSGDEHDELKDLQFRRQQFSIAKQANEVKKLTQDSNIIVLPSKTGTHGQ